MRILTWPFRMLFGFVGFVLQLVGRLLGGILGLVVLLVGGIFCVTVVGAALGVPLIALGVLFLTRALF